jgi:hypothetical protein
LSRKRSVPSRIAGAYSVYGPDEPLPRNEPRRVCARVSDRMLLIRTLPPPKSRDSISPVRFLENETSSLPESDALTSPRSILVPFRLS